MCIRYTEMNLRSKTTLELRTVFHGRLGVPNSQVDCIWHWRPSANLLSPIWVCWKWLLWRVTLYLTQFGVSQWAVTLHTNMSKLKLKQRHELTAAMCIHMIRKVKHLQICVITCDGINVGRPISWKYISGVISYDGLKAGRTIMWKYISRVINCDGKQAGRLIHVNMFNVAEILLNIPHVPRQHTKCMNSLYFPNTIRKKPLNFIAKIIIN